MIDGADDDVAERAESLSQETQRHALAASGIARDHHEAAVAHGEFDATAEGVDGGRHVQGLDRDVGSEGVKLQTEEREQLLVHGSSSSRRGSGTYAGGSPEAAYCSMSSRRSGATPPGAASGPRSGSGSITRLLPSALASLSIGNSVASTTPLRPSTRSTLDRSQLAQRTVGRRSVR